MKLSDEMADMETNEMKLLDFPNEILLEIFCNLGDHTLVQAIGVCKRFKVVAKASFAKKYSGASLVSFYSVKVSGENYNDERQQYKEIFYKFGDNMRAIDIDFRKNLVATDHWLINLIQRFCKSTTKIKITNGKGVNLRSIICYMSNLSQLDLESVGLVDQTWTWRTYPKLVNFSASSSTGDHNAFAEFINHNPQLEHICLNEFIERQINVLYSVNGKLNNLKSLVLMSEDDSFVQNKTSLTMDSLNKLTVQVDENSITPFLTSVRAGLKSIEELTIYGCEQYKLRVRDMNVLCTFKMLKALNLDYWIEVSFDLLKILIKELPNLVSLSLGDSNDLYSSPDDLLIVASLCRKLSLLGLTINPELPNLDYNFCTRFADIMEVNGSNLKMELYGDDDKFTFTRDEARFITNRYAKIKFHRILYWKGYNAPCQSSDKNLLHLDKGVLKKIVSHLNGHALSALLRTCKQGQQLVIEHFMENNVFHCAVTPSKRTNENLFYTLGPYIRRINVDFYHHSYNFEDDENIEGTASHELKTKFMKCVNVYCGNSLTEMEIQSSVPITTNLRWPSLRKLKVSFIATLRFFQCPELMHLTVEHLVSDIVNGTANWANSNFPKLTILTFGWYDESTETLLCALNGTICSQIKELSIQGSFENDECRRWIKLTNILARLGHLVTLHLRIKGFENSNFKFLFEHCSMLVKLTIFYSTNGQFQKTYYEIFRTINSNCKQLEEIQLVVDTSDRYFNRRWLERIRSEFPRNTFNIVDGKMGKCFCSR